MNDGAILEPQSKTYSRDAKVPTISSTLNFMLDFENYYKVFLKYKILHHLIPVSYKSLLTMIYFI